MDLSIWDEILEFVIDLDDISCCLLSISSVKYLILSFIAFTFSCRPSISYSFPASLLALHLSQIRDFSVSPTVTEWSLHIFRWQFSHLKTCIPGRKELVHKQQKVSEEEGLGDDDLGEEGLSGDFIEKESKLGELDVESIS